MHILHSSQSQIVLLSLTAQRFQTSSSRVLGRSKVPRANDACFVKPLAQKLHFSVARLVINVLSCQSGRLLFNMPQTYKPLESKVKTNLKFKVTVETQKPQQPASLMKRFHLPITL